MRIGFLGLGKMGGGMAARLAEAGHEVTVWNRTKGRADEALDAGAAEAVSPAGAATDADAVFSMVSDDEASSRCWLAADGGLTTAAPGALVIECSTVSLEQSRRLAAEAKARGFRYIDCPVNGPPTAARAACPSRA